MPNSSNLHPALASALQVADLLLVPMQAILRRLLPDIAKDLPADEPARQRLVRSVDTLLMLQLPQSRLISQAVRHRFIRNGVDTLLGDTPASNVGEALLASAHEEMTSGSQASSVSQGTGMPPQDPIGLGVRSFTLHATPGANPGELAAAVAITVPGWTQQPMEGLPGFHSLRVPEGVALTVGQAWDLASRLRAHPSIDHAEPAIRQLPEIPAAAESGEAATLALFRTFGMQHHDVPETRDRPEWVLDRIHARAIWATGRKGEGVLIGHIDTGYTRHPEVLPNIRETQGYDTWNDDADATDDLSPTWWDRLRSRFPVATPGHGTATGSVIASPEHRQNTHDGTHHICGSAPAAGLMPIRATPTVVILPTGSQDEVARGILKATRGGAKVISMSLGSPAGSRELKAAIDHALDAGVIVCAAAGNVVLGETWFTQVTYPATYAGVVAVAACDFHYRPWRDSCRGPEVVVTAPGTDVWRASASEAQDGDSVQPVYTTGQGSGTSFAVAIVAGVAACWLNHWGGWDSLLAKLGHAPRRIPAAFIECLRRHEATPLVIPRPEELPDDLPDYPAFEAKDFGVGVLHVEHLLKVSPFDLALPDSAAASAFDQDLARTTLGEIARTLPRVSKHTLRRALSAELGLTDAQLNLFLGRHGRELLHHVTTSSSLRTRLREITGATAPTDAAKVAAAAVATLAPFASSPLSSQLALLGSAGLSLDLDALGKHAPEHWNDPRTVPLPPRAPSSPPDPQAAANQPDRVATTTSPNRWEEGIAPSIGIASSAADRFSQKLGPNLRQAMTQLREGGILRGDARLAMDSVAAGVGEVSPAPQLPISAAIPLMKPNPGENWLHYKDRVLNTLGPLMDRLRANAGLQNLQPIFSGNAVQTQAILEQIVEAAQDPGLVQLELDPSVDATLLDDVGADVELPSWITRNPTTDGRGIRVAVLDSGVDTRHPWLRVVDSVSIQGQSTDIPGSHGTHVAGCIASQDEVYRGVAPGVDLLNIRVLDANGSGHKDDVARGIDAALDRGAQIINLSLGWNHRPRWSQGGHNHGCPDGRCLLCLAVDNAMTVLDGAVAVVVAAGNEHQHAQFLRSIGHGASLDTELGCPAQARLALTVGAITKQTFDTAPFSSRGPTAYGSIKPDIAAPGVNITSCGVVPRTVGGRPLTGLTRSDLSRTDSGTSMAAPIVAGAAALVLHRLLTEDPGRSVPFLRAEVRRILLTRAFRHLTAPATEIGVGRLNLGGLA